MRDIFILAIPVLVAIIAALVRAYALPFYRGVVIPYFKNRTTPKQREALLRYVGVAVSYAEKLFNEKGMGVSKKDFVINFIHNKFGYKIDEALVNAFIEAAVFEMNKLKAEEEKNTLIMR